LVLGVVVVLPPLFGLVRRYEFVEAVQFSVYAMVVPALIALGAPWEGFGSPPGRRTELGRVPSWLDRLVSRRQRHRSPTRSALVLAAFMAVVVAWRTPGAVAALVAHPWFVALEAASLAVVGVALWLELVESGRLAPRARRPFRAVMAAVAMWTVWTIAYLGGFSSTTWYTGFHHLAGRGLSAAADQQFSTAVCWFVAALSFMPVVFWNLLTWLRSEDDLDTGLPRAMPEVAPVRVGPSPVSS
jgi:cytochrome c oxidase assembly factor CtaG